MTKTITKVGILRCGQMGAGIAANYRQKTVRRLGRKSGEGFYSY